jgi:hypothetical protein
VFVGSGATLAFVFALLAVTMGACGSRGTADASVVPSDGTPQAAAAIPPAEPKPSLLASQPSSRRGSIVNFLLGRAFKKQAPKRRASVPTLPVTKPVIVSKRRSLSQEIPASCMPSVAALTGEPTSVLSPG